MTGRHRPRRRAGLVRLVAGVLLMATGGALLVSMHSYRRHAFATARVLEGPVAAPAPTRGPRHGCTAPPPSAATPAGTARAVLSMPGIGVSAPVLAGTSDAVLDVGVGHLGTSRWPDQGGTDVLEAHNVTFFARLPRLRPGATVTLTARCRSWTYTVRSGRVVAEGTPVRDRAAPTLVLVTCWPTDALYFTDHRYVVTAALSAVRIAAPVLPGAAPPTAPTAALPPALAHQDLGPDRVGIPLGTLHVSDPAAPRDDRGALAFAASGQAVRLLVAGELAARRDRAGWWRVLAPRLPWVRAAPLAGLTWAGRLDTVLAADHGRITGVTMSGPVVLRSGRGALLTVRMRVLGGRLLMSGVRAVPAAGR